MTDDDAFELSRRKALAGIGTIGVASAGAGLGTSAFFSDTETFTDNVLTAGELDLKVDWQEHYSDWSPDEDGSDTPNDPSDDVRVTMDDPMSSDWTAFPPGASNHPNPGFQGGPLLWVHDQDVDQFMKNTATEAYPDRDNDRLHDVTLDDDELPIYDACEDGADAPDDLDPRVPDSLRSVNDDTVIRGENGGIADYKPLISLDDVKPGDFGEVTFSFHLCDNDGYVWLQAGNVTESENGVNEAEADDGDEDQVESDSSQTDPSDPPLKSTDPTPGGKDVELTNAIRTAWWYDPNGNNLIDSEQGGPVDVMICLDTSGSLSDDEADTLRDAGDNLVQALVNAPNSDVNVGGLRFASGITLDRGLGPGAFTFGGSGSGGTTAMPAALDIADQHLDDGRANAEQIIILLTDGGPNYSNTTGYTDGTYNAPRAEDWTATGGDSPSRYDNGSNAGVSSGELDETQITADNIKDATGTSTGDSSRIVTVGIGDPQLVGGISLDDYLKNRIASPGDHFNANSPNAVNDIINELVVTVVLGEQVFRYGRLGDDLDLLSSGLGLPLDGDLTTSFLEGATDTENDNEERSDADSDADSDPDRECFTASTDHYIGFSWWLPLDHGNEVQSDSVTFDLGFYTEQCRHNDGSGQEAES